MGKTVTQILKGSLGLNLDDHVLSDQYNAEQDYVNAYNIRNTVNGSQKFHRITNVKGTREVEFDLPDGMNKCIGACEDKEGKSILYFIYNSASNHCILRYYTDSGAIEQISQDSIFDFDEYNFVTGARLVDRKYFYFTDAKDYDGSIEGNEPRKLNIEKANITGKQFVYHVHFPKEDGFKNGYGFEFGIKDKNGNDILPQVTNYIVSGGDKTRVEGVKALASQINSGLNSFMTAEAVGCYLKITMASTGYQRLNVRVVDTGVNTLAYTAASVPENFYIEPYIQDYIDLIKYPPTCPPKAEFAYDEDKKTNYVKNKTFQFRPKYLYDDYEQSVWGPISQLVYESESECSGGDNNYISIDFTDERLNDEAVLAILKKVKLAFREGNTGQWYEIETLDLCDIGVGSQIYKFYNDGAYKAIPDSELSEQYDNVPQKALSLEYAKNRLHLAGVLEGHDVPNPLEVDHSIRYKEVESEQEETGTVTGRIRIHNRFPSVADYREWQPIHIDASESQYPVFGGFGESNYVGDVGTDYEQYLPANGFTVYLEGTDYKATSVQNPTGLSYANAQFNIVNSDKAADRSDIRDLIFPDSFYSEFTIENVPPGRYKLCVASHWCSVGDVLDKGDMYDLSKGRAYQKTSTYVAGIGTLNNRTEIEVVVQANGTVDTYATDGYIIIADLTNTDLGFFSIALSGYLVDGPNGPTSDPTELKTSVRVERQSVDVRYDLVNQSSFTNRHVFPTDKNGFWFWNIGSAILASLGVTQIQVNSAYGVAKDYNQQMYEGGLKELVAGTLSTKKNDAHSASKHEQYIIYNQNSDLHDYGRTRIEGRVVDQNGDGVKGVLVVHMYNCRWEYTDSNGEYSILAYANSYGEGAKRTVYYLLFTDVSSLCTLTFNPSRLLPNIDDISQNGYNDSTPFPMDDLVVQVIQEEIRNYLKRGGVYPYGIVYADRGNRRCMVARNEEMKIEIPYHTENGIYGQPLIDWEIHHTPPDWATHYWWVMATNRAKRSHLTWAINDVKYVTRYNSDPATDEPVETSFSNGDASEIYLSFNNLQNYRDENTDSILDLDDGSNEFFIDQSFVGNRLRILFDNNGNLESDFIDVKVRGLRDGYVVIEALESLPEIKGGYVVEVIAPRIQTDEETTVYYEIGECYEILNPGTSSRAHEGGEGGQDQTSSQPAKGTFTNGDTYWRRRIIPVVDSANNISTRYDYILECENVSDFYASKVSDIGRVHLEDDTVTQEYLPTLDVFSDKILIGTKINGLSTFKAANRHEFPRDFGAINKLIMAGNVMKAIHELRIISIYLDEAIFKDVEGADVVALGDRVVGNYRVSESGEYGTRHPESVVEHNTRIFFWDDYKRVYVQNGQNGSEVISNLKVKSWFKETPDQYDPYPFKQYKVISTVDEYNEEVIVTFQDVYEKKLQLTSGPGQPERFTLSKNTLLEGHTIAYSLIKRRWITFYSFIPEMYSQAGDRFISLLNGQVYEHDSDLRNNFYGVQYTSIWTPVANIYRELTKIWLALRQLNPTQAWDVPNIVNGRGQESWIKKARFKRKEKDLHSDFLRDINTTKPNAIANGDVLRSGELEIKLEDDSTEHSEIEGVWVLAVTDERTMQ